MSRVSIFFFTVAIAFGIFSCKETPEQSDSRSGKTGVKAKNKPIKLFAGKPDLPQNSDQITSAGIGSVLLGDSIEKFSNYIMDENVKVEDITIAEDGKEWPGKRFTLRNKYLVAEMVNTVHLISKIKTNIPSIKTKEGLHAGMSLDSLINLRDSLNVDFEHKAFMYGKSGVWFKVDKKRERKFFLQKSKDPASLRGGKVEELFIICGDC